MAALVDREMRIADLAIHGWEPARREGLIGLVNRGLQIGFGLQVGPMSFDPLNLTQGMVRRFGIPLPEACDWDEVTDEILDRIDERLNAV